MVFTRRSDLVLTTLPNCAGLRENGTCSWLDVTVCIGADCHYNHCENSLEKSYVRLRSLDEEAQQRIAQKYYGGSRPWTAADASTRGRATCL